MVRLKCRIPFHQDQIHSHLCALAAQCLSSSSITITVLKEHLAGPQLQHISVGLKSSQWVSSLHWRHKTFLLSLLFIRTKL